MIEQNNKNNFINNFTNFYKKNYKILILILIFIFLIFVIFQFMQHREKIKVLELSILYDQAISELDKDNLEENMIDISNENGIYSILAKLELIKKNTTNKNYNYAYNQYIELLKNNNIDNIYNSIIALHGSYNLIDYVSVNEIIELLSYVDENYKNLQGHKKEIEYLISIKNNDKFSRENIYKAIISNKNIPTSIKERVRKINEFEKNK